MMENISGWGRHRLQNVNFLRPTNARFASAHLEVDQLIARGSGRSYGDSSMAQTVCSTAAWNSYYDFDEHTGILHCQSGVVIAQILKDFIPRRWLLPVVPGSQHVTVGGAIASDVHGKNHVHAGCFSECVLSLSVVTNENNVVECSRYQNSDLFFATCGGMGLTGIICDVRIQLQKTKDTAFRTTSKKIWDLERLLCRFDEEQPGLHRMAWIDSLAPERVLGRSILTSGLPTEWAVKKDFKSTAIPAIPLQGFFRRPFLQMVNSMYFRSAKDQSAETLKSFFDFNFPLDKINNWNMFFGGKGFVQYQCVIPTAKSAEGVKKILQLIRTTGVAPFLVSLKKMGVSNRNHLSFPLQGMSLAIDIKWDMQTAKFIKKADELVLESGGRVYLAKDAHLDRQTFQMYYPRGEEFLTVRKKYGVSQKFSSSQSRRLGLTP